MYSDIKQKHSLKDDESLMNFFLEVLKRRDDLDEQEEQERTTARAPASFPLAGGAAQDTEFELVSAAAATSRPGDLTVQLVAKL